MHRNMFIVIVPLLCVVMLTAAVSAQEHSAGMTMDMSGAFHEGIPMQRDGSGTSWLPDSSPLHAVHFQYGQWSLMAHGNLFLRYTDQDAGRSGTRGEEKLDAPNWFMLMGKRSFGESSRLTLRGMLSLDLLTEGGRGYPLLIQSGETWHGKRLIDRQHPHDLFGELSVSYGRSTGRHSGLFLYFGLPGEPALGPPVYLHRPSAQNIPDAPLGHHWQDSSHITFGVITVGYLFKQFKLDGSLFNGREPDEKRYNIDRPRFDSASIRVSLNPSEDTAFQISHGYVKDPEILEPGISIHRTTASFLWNYPVASDTGLSAAFIWGMNKPRAGDAQNSFLLEADYQVKKNSLFMRMEFVKKSGEELGIEEQEDRLFSVSAFSLGAARTIFRNRHVTVSFGALCTVNPVDKKLRPVYGDLPFSAEVFLRLGPVRISTGERGMHAVAHDGV